jgi:hypothetical protein
MTLYEVQGRENVDSTNAVQRRMLLEQREKELHERLTEETRRLQTARAQEKMFEEAMERTLKELHSVRQEWKELTQLLEGVWNGPAAGQQKANNIVS